MGFFRKGLGETAFFAEKGGFPKNKNKKNRKGRFPVKESDMSDGFFRFLCYTVFDVFPRTACVVYGSAQTNNGRVVFSRFFPDNGITEAHRWQTFAL